jgi:hypothetical protein
MCAPEEVLVFHQLFFILSSAFISLLIEFSNERQLILILKKCKFHNQSEKLCKFYDKYLLIIA